MITENQSYEINTVEKMDSLNFCFAGNDWIPFSQRLQEKNNSYNSFAVQEGFCVFRGVNMAYGFSQVIQGFFF